jgi:hypothetical protein
MPAFRRIKAGNSREPARAGVAGEYGQGPQVPLRADSGV